MEDYKYKLQYINNEEGAIHEFPADVDIYDLADYLRRFLYSCGWSEEQIEQILISEGEEE